MAKGDDAVRRKKSRTNRKRLRKDSSSIVSARIASIIAAKQRRKSGKRRMCEGMCFSLPTLEDPFNDGHELKSENKEKPKNLLADTSSTILEAKQKETEKHIVVNGKVGHNKVVSRLHKDRTKCVKTVKSNLANGGMAHAKEQGLQENLHGPSKFLSLCLQSIQNELRHDDAFNNYLDRPLLFNMWGLEFWKCCQNGLDVLETSGPCCSVEQIAWIASAATDLVATRERKGQSLAHPFLLFLVPSQKKALEVRSVCKPLKECGIHSVSLHAGASLDHQIQGLKNCEPEFLISTPERLVELVTVGAMDLSEISFLVVDGLETFVRNGALDKIKLVKQFIQGSHMTVICNNSFEAASISAVQELMRKPMCRLSLTDSIPSKSACMHQFVHVCAPDERRSKSIQILSLESGKESFFKPIKVLFVVGTTSNALGLHSTLITEGYISCDRSSNGLKAAFSEKVVISVAEIEVAVDQLDIGQFEVVILVDFPASIDLYVRILTKMARRSVRGVLHSLLCEEDAPVAGLLIQILEECGQIVPQTIREYISTSILEH
ncbi:hypothetical protein Sjap_013587 [Stephania japonica]|uniref:DEAD/DEAH box helicase domain-containing protein n=1 Tax=Stephania japonica TaxID=461633 RepID=A0AAP0P039_9MAGN